LLKRPDKRGDWPHWFLFKDGINFGAATPRDRDGNAQRFQFRAKLRSCSPKPLLWDVRDFSSSSFGRTRITLASGIEDRIHPSFPSSSKEDRERCFYGLPAADVGRIAGVSASIHSPNGTFSCGVLPILSVVNAKNSRLLQWHGGEWGEYDDSSTHPKPVSFFFFFLLAHIYLGRRKRGVRTRPRLSALHRMTGTVPTTRGGIFFAGVVDAVVNGSKRAERRHTIYVLQMVTNAQKRMENEGDVAVADSRRSFPWRVPLKGPHLQLSPQDASWRSIIRWK